MTNTTRTDSEKQMALRIQELEKQVKDLQRQLEKERDTRRESPSYFTRESLTTGPW
jgi:hypothetical protein